MPNIMNIGGGYFITVGDCSKELTGTVTYTPVITTEKTKNPFVPEKIYSNKDARTVVVLWADGEKSKVTCDAQDNFSVELGFAMALTQRIFGGKSEFKKKWWPIISRRIQES
jgi:hypothetical protein